MIDLSLSQPGINFGVIIAIIAAVFVLQQRRTPQSAVAWLMFIVIIPYLAVPVFLVLGFRKQGSRFPPISFSQSEAQKDRPPAHALDDVFRRLGLASAEAGNSFRLLETAEAAYQAMMQTVAGARRRLDVTFYIVEDDEVGEAFVDALTKRAREGVEVKLILDRLGTLRRPKAALKRLEEAGGELRYFSPLLHPPDNGHINLRNHRKMVIADGACVFAGGMNVGQTYMGPGPSKDRFVDLAYCVKGPAALAFLDVHHSDWDVSGQTPKPLLDEATKTDGAAVVQLVPSGPDVVHDPLNDGLIYALHNARTRISIATPYFLPTEGAGQALAMAARRGVDVSIIVPRRSNQRMADFARGAYLRELSEAGCRILLYEAGMMHAKMGVVDDCAYVGSANFDVRSMLLNFETVLFVYDSDSRDQLVGWFDALAAQCTQGVEPARLPRRIAEGVFRLGAPVL